MILCALLAALSPSVGWSQAGLFWDNSEKIRSTGSSGWDSGNRGTSALGQLESLTGQKVDTSRGATGYQTQPARPKVVKRPTLSMKQQVGLMLFESLLEQVLSDSLSGNNQAASAAALEQQRLAAELKRQEDLRKARILHAKWRAEWDARDEASTEQLAGVFQPVPPASAGTAFFGIPGGVNPRELLRDVDLFAEDSSVVDLRGATSLTVPLLREPTAGRLTTGNWPITSVGLDEARDYRGVRERSVPEPVQRLAALAQEHMVSTLWQKFTEGVPAVGDAIEKVQRLPGVGAAMELYEQIEKAKERFDTFSGLTLRLVANTMGAAHDVATGRAHLNASDRFQDDAQGFQSFAIKDSASEVASKLTDGLEGEDVDDHQSTVVPLTDVGPPPDTARCNYHKFRQWLR